MQDWVGFFYPGSGGAAFAFGPPRLARMEIQAHRFEDAAQYFIHHTRNSDRRIAVCEATFADVFERAIEAKLKRERR